jgi:hypothetical protein
MYVSDEFRLVFLAQPRTASRAVAKLLTEQFGAVDTPTQGSEFGAGHHSAGIEYTLKYQRRGYTVFTVVRNHWDVIISWWYNNNCSPPWEDWLDYWCRDEQTNRWTAPGQLFHHHPPMADLVIRYESLETELSELIGQPVEIPQIGLSPRVHYSHYYNAGEREQVGDYYAAEIELYGYGFESDHDCESLCSNPQHQPQWMHGLGVSNA